LIEIKTYEIVQRTFVSKNIKRGQVKS